MKISDIAIRRPITTVMFFCAIAMLGLVAATKLSLQMLPNISPPYGGVRFYSRQSMSKEEVERKIIIPIEGEIAQIPHVKNTRTYGYGTGGFFFIEFEFGTNVKYRIVDLQERLDRFRKTFPRNSLYLTAFPFETAHFNKEFMDLVLKAPRSDPYLEAFNTDRIQQKLQDIDGVANAEIRGGKRRSIDVNIIQDRMQEFGTTLWQIRNQVQTFANEPVFLGDIEDRNTKYFVRLDGQFKDTSEISDVVVKAAGGIAVRHLGEVESTSHTRRSLRRIDGKPALGLSLEKEALVNPIELSNRTRKVIDTINRTLPEGYELQIGYDVADSILDLLKSLSKLAILGITLAMFVLYLFLRNLRMSLIICVVIPICIVTTFNFMYFFGMTINIISLLGLAVGVGCLIDSSIVVLENVFRHHERGKNAIQSAFTGCHEVGKAVFALTLTNVVVFLPIVFVDGQIRLTFTEGALAIIFPMLISMFVALTLVPMATSRLLFFSDRRQAALETSGRTSGGFKKRKERIIQYMKRIPHPTMSQIRSSYSSLLKSCLRHRIRFLIAIVLAILYTRYYSLYNMNQGVMKEPEDENYFYVHVFLPTGTTQDYTVNVVNQVEDFLMEQVPENEHIHTWIDDDNAHLRIMLVDESERDRKSENIREDLRPHLDQFADAEVSFNWSRPRGENATPQINTGQGGVIEIRGPEYEQINDLAINFAEVLGQIDGIRDVISESEPGALEIHFQLDRDAAALLQVTPQLVAQSVQMAQRRGDYSTFQMKQGDDEIDIIFSLLETQEDLANREDDEVKPLSFEELYVIPIYSPAIMTTVPLEDLGTMDIKRGMSNIQRENRERISRIRFETAPNSSFSEIEESVRILIENYPIPAGYRMSLGGQYYRMDEDLSAFFTILYLAFFLMYMCIASLFESFAQPIIIMLAIPLAILGIVWSFILTGHQFNELAMLGCIFLIGMLPNSAILLVHFSGFLRKEKNYPRERAIMVSGQTRLRPIFMTVLTTILGLVPMAIGDKEWVPFAIAVIGGLGSSTILTLVVVPGFYFIIEDITNLIMRCIRYLTSWRWVLIFWSRKRRYTAWEGMTAYRRKVPRVEPMIVEIDHLTRIYPISRLESLRTKLKRLIAIRVFSPSPGFVPNVIEPPAAAGSTLARTKALDTVSLNIEAGLFGLLGPNGAGKTTLLRLIAGIDQATRGYLSICGYDVKHEARKAQKLIGYLPQNFGVYSHLTAYRYLDYHALLKGIRRKKARSEAIHKALEMTNLLDKKNVRVGDFSGGMKRRIGLAQIFLQPPKVLIVDEPTVGLDPVERLNFRNLLVQLSQERVVILSTHIVEDVAHSCREMALMDEGKLLYKGSTKDLAETVQGKVWEIIVSDETAWHDFRKRFKVAGQSQTPGGIRLRLISDEAPSPEAQTVTPTLEDAYLYYTHIRTLPDSESVSR